MDRDAFTEGLTKDGYSDTVLVTREANTAMNIHTHPFDSRVLILEGELHLRIGDDERTHRAGDVFHLGANEAHSERYGPKGVTFLVGRK
jgi:quercetin dioxygenase-like cupin family protein